MALFIDSNIGGITQSTITDIICNDILQYSTYSILQYSTYTHILFYNTHNLSISHISTN